MPRPVVPMTWPPLLGQAFFFPMMGEDDMGMVADQEVAANADAAGAKGFDLLEELFGIDDHAVGDDRLNAGPKHAGGQQGEFEGLAIDNDGMAGVGSAVETDHEVVLIGEQINDLALGLVAPLQADDTGGHAEKS